MNLSALLFHCHFFFRIAHYHPKELIAVEKEGIAKRRVDILCYAKNIHPTNLLHPLLLIECKAGFLSQDALDQAVGYNHHIGARFVAVASATGFCLSGFSELPSYETLLNAAKR